MCIDVSHRPTPGSFGSDADLIVQCLACTGFDVSVCLSRLDKEFLLRVPHLLAAVSAPVRRDAQGVERDFGWSELTGFRLDLALLTVFMGNDYMPSLIGGELKHVLPEVRSSCRLDTSLAPACLPVLLPHCGHWHSGAGAGVLAASACRVPADGARVGRSTCTCGVRTRWAW